MTTLCPSCKIENGEDALYCKDCGTDLRGAQISQEPFRLTSSPRATLGSISVGNVQIPIETLAVLVLLIAQAILSFVASSEFSDISLSSGDGLFSISLTSLFVLVGILELAAAFGIFRKLRGAMIMVGTLAIIDLSITPAQTIVSILLIILLVYLNRSSLSRLGQRPSLQ